MNTSHKYDNGVSSYGLDILNQKKTIEYKEFINFQYESEREKTLLPFQKGFLKI